MYFHLYNALNTVTHSEYTGLPKSMRNFKKTLQVKVLHISKIALLFLKFNQLNICGTPYTQL